MAEITAEARAAAADYRQYRDMIRDQAKTSERKRKPITAAKYMNYARICHRAAIAEEIDPAPAGLRQ